MTLTVVCGQTKLHIFDEEAKLSSVGSSSTRASSAAPGTWYSGQKTGTETPPGSWGPVKMCRKCFPGGKG